MAKHPRRSPVTFFVLVLALSVPFWIAGALIDLSRTLPVDLPVSSLQTVCPLIAALILLGRDEGSPGMGQLWKRIVDLRGITPWFWYLPAALLAPGIVVLSYAVLVLSGARLPDLHMALLAVPIFVVVFLLAAVGEEGGWSGYVIDPLQHRWGALRAALALGVFWGLWHLLGWSVQAHHTLAWTAGMFGCTVAWRVLIVWLYNNTHRSVSAAVLFHASINLGEFLFPNYGSYFDPVVAAAIAVPVAAAVVILWGPDKMTRFRFGGNSRGHRPPGS